MTLNTQIHTGDNGQPKVRVLVVDDSALIRKLLHDILSRSPRLEVIDLAIDANDARQKIKLHNPDVITLDIEMPGMDGITFLDKIMRLRPMPVVMCSTLTQKGADATLRALSLGAVDFLPKPTSNVKQELDNYADELISKVLTAAQVKFSSNRVAASSTKSQVLSPPRKRQLPKLVAIGSSTGGTIALEAILTRLPANAPPIVIAQHIPGGFSAAFAQRVNGYAQITVKEAEQGDEIMPGFAYIAPGGMHLKVVNMSGKLRCHIDDGEKVNRHKPSVDVLFDSICTHKNKNVLGVMLTGMGKDGARGMKAMFDMGIETIAQDEKTSMVWGMPKQAIDLGGVSMVAALDNIAALILEHAY